MSTDLAEDVSDKRDRLRGSNGRFTEEPETNELDKRVWQLRSLRFSFQQIADQLGLSKTGAFMAWKRACKLILTPDQEERRQGELDELDRISRHLLGVMTRQRVMLSGGKPVMLNGETLYDDSPSVQAALGLLKTQERRARLLGLDSPKRHEVSGRGGGPIEAPVVVGAQLQERIARTDAAAARMRRELAENANSDQSHEDHSGAA